MRTEDFAYFNELYKKRSITKVSQSFGVSQPSVSMALKRLEGSFQSKLFTRGTSKSQLTFTQAGEQLYKHTSSIMFEVESALNELNNINSHSITIGLPPILKSSYFNKIAKVSQQFNQNFNIKNMHIYEAGSSALRKRLIKGDIDIAILGSLNSDVSNELIKIPFMSANFKVYLSKNNPLSKKSVLFIDDLKSELFVGLDSDFIHDQVMNDIGTAGTFNPEFFMKTSDISFLINMVSDNLGISILADIVKPTLPNIVTLPLKYKNQSKFVGNIAYRKNHILTTGESMLIDVFTNHPDQAGS